MISIEPTVLHVEDDLNDRIFLQNAFRKARLPLRLEAVPDGEAAQAYLEGTDLYGDRSRFPLPSLVLLDLKMPRMNGFELLRWIRGQPQFDCLPVVILTSSSNEADIRDAFKLGANSYLLKPLQFEALIGLVKEMHQYWFVLDQSPA